MRRRFFRRRRRRTNWIPGINFGEGVQQAAVVMTGLGGVGVTTAFSVDLTNAADLASSGGEDAVVVRCVGLMQFHSVTRPVTNQPAWLRIALVTSQISTVGAAINTRVPDLFALAELANENILWMSQVYCGTSDLELAASEALALESGVPGNWLQVDTAAKRRLSEDSALVLTIQGCPTSGGVGSPTGCEISGWIRVLLQAPHL